VREGDGGGGSEIRVRGAGVGWGGGMKCGYWVGWWEGVFAKVDGGVCKNDVNLEFLLLRVE
jgi:hypothetical protein